MVRDSIPDRGTGVYLKLQAPYFGYAGIDTPPTVHFIQELENCLYAEHSLLSHTRKKKKC